MLSSDNVREIQGQVYKAPLGLLSWFVAVAIWIAWAPFEGHVGVAPRLHLYSSVDMETIAHLLLLVPIAVVLAVLAHGSDGRRPFLRVWGTVTVLGLLLELGQWWVKGRTTSLYDVLCNGIGAAFAIWGTTQLMRCGMGVRPILAGMSLLVLAAILLGMVYTVFIISGGRRLAGWDPHFVVLAGNEVGRRRPYQGRIWDARICAGEPSRAICVAPGADAETRQRLTTTAAESHRVELSAYVQSHTDRQRGPARIVTFSQGAALRNVTLAQEQQNLIFRVRTPWSGANGTHPEFVLSDAVPTGMPTRVVATFRRGVVTLTAQSPVGTVSATFHPRLLHLRPSLIQTRRLSQRLPVMWRGRAALVGAGMICASFGLAMGWLLKPRWRAAVLAGPAVAVGSIWVVETWVLGTFPLNIMAYVLAMGSAALGVGLAVWDWRRMLGDVSRAHGSWCLGWPTNRIRTIAGSRRPSR